MRVTITLDYYDGSQSKIKECDMEELPMDRLRMIMMQADVASVSITKVQSLEKMVGKLNGS